jgi:hypothetical protein
LSVAGLTIIIVSEIRELGVLEVQIAILSRARLVDHDLQVIRIHSKKDAVIIPSAKIDMTRLATVRGNL